MARGLFVEPFYGGSHRAFLDGLARTSSHELTLLTLPEGEWRRRMRRGAQELAAMAAELNGDHDFLVASDMLDLGTFLALTRPRFQDIPVLAYFHENQFTYPRIRGTKLNSWFGQMNYISALAADVVAFNSEYHRQDFLGALRTLAGQPNNWLVEDSIGHIEAKSQVLPVGVELDWIPERSAHAADGPRTILWNHRWEFDKAPEMFARALGAVAAAGIDFRLVIAGEPGVNPSPVLAEIRDAYPERVTHFGYAESQAQFGALLAASDVVISTTRHEFFGVGMVEAMAAGCIPCAPRRYNYPALVPPEWHNACLWEDERELVAKLSNLLTGPLPSRSAMQLAAARFGWARVGPDWDAALDSLASRKFATN